MMAEIIAPAKNINMLNRVIDAGAGMVYAGIKGFCRKEKDGVSSKEFKLLGDICKNRGVKLIAAFNLLPSAGEVPKFLDGINQALEDGAHGVIINDPGIIREARNRFPKLYIMASIGMSPLNWREVDFIAKAGANTVLLPEFFNPDEIKAVREKCDVGIEFFALGIKEFGYTGKCIMSSYHRQFYNGKSYIGSAKRGGVCGDVCRACFQGSGGVKGDIYLRFSRFTPDEKLMELLPHVDIFKFMQGSLKIDELCDMISMFRRDLG